MSNFSVRTATLEREANDIKSICSSMNVISDTLDNISANLHIESLNTAEIKRKLRVIHENILNEAAKMSSLSDALNTAAELYKKTETNIINGNFTEISDAVSTAAVTLGVSTLVTQWINIIQDKVRMALMELGFITPQEQKRVEGQQVTASQQKEQDLYMQKKISDLKSNPRYSESTWKKASLEERKLILNDYISEVSGIMGLEYDEINFEYRAPQNGYVTYGSYSRSLDEIMINEYIIENRTSPGDLFTTIQHELRHAYQHKVCENPEKYVVTDETAAAWQKSFDEYKNTNGFMREGLSQSEAYQAYRNQTVEKDARNFAKEY